MTKSSAAFRLVVFIAGVVMAALIARYRGPGWGAAVFIAALLYFNYSMED